MSFPHVNALAVLAGGVLVFLLGGVWYSPALFAKRWVALLGKTEEDLRGAPGPNAMMFVKAFVCGLAVSLTLAIILNHFPPMTAARGAIVGALCWFGFAGATSYANAVFSQKPVELWLIDSGYNLVSFVLTGVLLGVWR